MLRIFLTIVLFVTVAPVLAVEIAISSGDWRPIKIAVEHFLGEERLPAEGFSDIIISNLSRSGTFLAYADAVNSHFLSGTKRAERFYQARGRGIEYLLTGAITEDSGDKHNVSFVLWDVVTEKVWDLSDLIIFLPVSSVWWHTKLAILSMSKSPVSRGFFTLKLPMFCAIKTA